MLVAYPISICTYLSLQKEERREGKEGGEWRGGKEREKEKEKEEKKEEKKERNKSYLISMSPAKLFCCPVSLIARNGYVASCYLWKLH